MQIDGKSEEVIPPETTAKRTTSSTKQDELTSNEPEKKKKKKIIRRKRAVKKTDVDENAKEITWNSLHLLRIFNFVYLFDSMPSLWSSMRVTSCICDMFCT